MKSTVFLVVFLILTPWIDGLAQTASTAPRLKKVAVYDFEDSAVAAEVKIAYGEKKDVGALVAREIVARLVNSSQFDVIDRADIAKIMKEKNYHNDARFNGGAAEAGRIGRILNVDAIIVGTIETVSSQVNDHKIGIGLAVGGKREAEADVSVTIRVLSTQTSQIFLADTADKKEKHSLGAGGGYGTKANSGSGAEAQYPGAYPLTLALQHAADDLADKIIARAAALQPRGIGDTQNAYSSVPGNAAFSGGAHTPNENSTSSAPAPAITSATPFLPLVVGKVDGKKIYITAGSNAGVTMNQAVEVRRVNGSMKDPNGVDIPLEDTVEVAVVTEVEDRYAIAEVQRSDKSSAKVGDKIKLVQPATKEQAQKDKAHRSKVPWKAFVLP